MPEVPEEFVVDLMLEFAEGEVDADAVLSDLLVPGCEVASMAGPDCLAVTTVVAATTELCAVEAVHDSLVSQLGRARQLITATAVVSVGVGSLYALVDPGLPLDEYEHLDIADLVERHVWNRPAWAYHEYVEAERRRMATTA